MAIRQEDVELVRQQSDLVAIIGERCTLKRSGRQWMAICPFHAENTASMSVNGEKGYFHCFGCQKRGDVITFIRELDHLTFVEAVEQLARRANIEIHHDESAVVTKERQRKSALGAAMAQAVDWYHQRLLRAPDAGAARAYLRDRGYDKDLVEQFKIGWAPDAWDALGKSLNLSSQDLRETGLGFVNRRGRIQDSFRARVMFPIFDSSGNAVAFGGRVLPGSDDPAKYKNSQETTLYKKSRTLYALNWAKADVMHAGELIVCEGYTDVIAFFQAGLPRAVATCGTALTEGHVRQMLNFAKRIVLAYDADRAGQEAAGRVYEWERKFGIDIAVAALPAGKDPADLFRSDPDALKRAVAEAKPYLQFRLDRAFVNADLRTVEGRARAARTAVGMIREQPDSLVRDQYLMTVADRTRVDVDDLRHLITNDSDANGLGVAGDLPAPVTRVVDVRGAAQKKGDPPEVEMAALGLAVHDPSSVVEFLQKVAPADLPDGVEEVFFEDVCAQQAFAALLSTPSFLAALDSAGPEAGDLLGRLATQDTLGDAADEYTRLIDRAAHRVMRELELEVRSQPANFVEIVNTIAWLKLTVEQLRTTVSRDEAATALLRWMLTDSASSAENEKDQVISHE